MIGIKELFARNGIIYPLPKFNSEGKEGMQTFTGQVRQKQEDGTYVVVAVEFHVTQEVFDKVKSGEIPALSFTQEST